MILMNDFKAEPEALLQAEAKAAERVIRSGYYILGKEVQEFEKEWAAASATKHSIGVANGLDAIEIGLRAMGFGAGDEIITTPMTAFATVLAIYRAGAIPVLADICADTGLLDPLSVERCITKRTKAVLLVHLFGQVRSMQAWQELCEQHHLFLLEDCAQSHLAREGNQVAGNFGSWGAYSFYPTKNLGAPGDAGAFNTKDDVLAAQAKTLRNYGQSEKYKHVCLGLNSRLDELHAAILRERLHYLPEFTLQRQTIAKYYFEEIKNPSIEMLSKPLQWENHVFHLFVVKCAQRQKLMDHLKRNGIESLVHYPISMHQQEAAAGIQIDPHGLSASEDFSQKCLSIPCHPQMKMADMEQVVNALNRFSL